MERGVQRFLDGVTGAPLWEQLPPHARAQLLDNAPAMAAETASPIYYPPVSAADVRGIELPVLLLTGAHSPRMFHLVTDELERLLPNRERAAIPNASHSIHTGNPAAYSAAVLEFLARH